MLVAVLLTACSQVNNQSPPTTSGEARSLLTSLQRLVSGWNANQLRWVTAYSDSEIAWAEFLIVQDEVYRAQLGLLVETDLALSQLSDELEVAGEEILDHYRERFDLLEVIFASAVQEDEVAFESAGADYYELTKPEAVLPIVERLFRSPAVEAAFAAEGFEPESVIESLTRSVGAGG